MKLELSKTENFWCLINPEDVQNVIVILNENAPVLDISFEELPLWAKQQIVDSELSGKVRSTPKAVVEIEKPALTKEPLIDVVIPAKKTQEKKASTKKVARHVGKKNE